MSNVYEKLRAYILKYVSFTDEEQATVAALWIIGTYLWSAHFDAYPYMAVTADTKRAGKTRLGIDVVGNTCNVPRTFVAATPAAMFQSIEEEEPTVQVDEAERMSSSAAGPMREITNAGYRRGQTVQRKDGKQLVQYKVFGPKVFVLIGDVNDTLRDRSIVFRMKRADEAPEYRYRVAQAEGAAIRAEIQALFTSAVADVKLSDGTPKRIANTEAAVEVGEIYQTFPFAALRFLSDRDAEIWQSMFALAQYFGIDRAKLERIAVDMSTEKTAEARRYVELRGAEDSTQDDAYARRLLADVRATIGDAKGMFTKDLLEALYEIPTAPWRKLRGVGLSPNDLGNTLSRFGVQPKQIRLGGRGVKHARGYLRSDLDSATTLDGK